jgi:phosphoenolpyruvate carboxykinase (GTP)
VLKWIFETMQRNRQAVDTPIGRLPTPDDLDTTGLDMPPASLAKLLNVDVSGWLAEVPLINNFFDDFGDRLPGELRKQVSELEKRLKG